MTTSNWSFSSPYPVVPFFLALNSSSPKPNLLHKLQYSILDHTLSSYITMKTQRLKDNLPYLPNVAEITCMDTSQIPPVSQKLSKKVRVIFFLVQNGVSRSKVIDDVQLMMKRGKNLRKAFNNVMLRHHEALTCRSRDSHMSFVSPMAMDYQFSCSGRPPRPPRTFSHLSKRRVSDSTTTCARQQRHHVGLCRGNDTLELVQHPKGRRVKIMGSASSMLRDAEEQEEFQVDEAAEEFIERFYRELRLQDWLERYWWRGRGCVHQVTWLAKFNWSLIKFSPYIYIY